MTSAPGASHHQISPLSGANNVSKLPHKGSYLCILAVTFWICLSSQIVMGGYLPWKLSSLSSLRKVIDFSVCPAFLVRIEMMTSKHVAIETESCSFPFLISAFLYRHISFYCTLLCFTELHFFYKLKGRPSTSKWYDSLLHWSRTKLEYIWGMPAFLNSLYDLLFLLYKGIFLDSFTEYTKLIFFKVAFPFL